MTLKVPDICAWFQRQQGAVRLETIVNLLQMLYPLELQFVGAYLEDLARRDYHCLRDVEHRFNIPEIVARLTDVNDGRCRASLIVALSLLKSSNHKTAATVYKILLSFHLVYRQLPKTKDVYEEILLLLTMAKHHPAFKFDQKTSVSGLLDEIDRFLTQNEPHSSMNEHEEPDHPNTPCDLLETSHHYNCADASTQTTIGDYVMITDDECINLSTDAIVAQPDGEPCPTEASSLASSPDLKASDVYATRVKVKGSQRKENMIEFTLETVWSNGDVTEVVKTQEDLYEFHRKLLDLFPSDAGCYGYNRRIPYFPGYRHSPELDVSVSPEIIQLVYHYIQGFLAVNEDILASRYAANFFKPSTSSSSRNDVRPTMSCSPDTGSSYCLNMLFEPNTRPTPTTYKQQNSNDTGSNEDDQDFVDNDGRLKSLVYYNSHMTTSPKGRSSDRIVSPKSTSLAESSTSCNLISKGACDSSQITFAGSDVSSTSRVVPLPASTVISPRAKDSSSYDAGLKLHQQPLLFVPKELYFILRRENLLKYKKYFVPFKIEDLLNINTEADVDEQMDVSVDDRKDVLRVLNILKQEILGHTTSTKNGFYDKRYGFAHHLQRKFENWDSENNDMNSSGDRSYARAPSTSSVDTIITDDNGPTRFVNGEINDTDHSDSVFVGRSNSTSAVASAMSTSTGSNNNRSNNNRPKSFHRHHSKNQLRKYSIPLNVERYGSTEDNNILSDSSCVSETPMMMRSIENDYPTAMRSFFGVSPLPSETSVGRGRPITKMSNSLPPSKSQSPVPNDISPSIGYFQAPFGQRKAMTPGGVVCQPPPMNFARGVNKPQPIRCLYPTNVVDSPSNQTNLRLNHQCNYQTPSMPPPSAIAYDMSRSNVNVPMFALPPPGSGFGFIRGPPPPPHSSITPLVLSCQCNGGGTCQACITNRWSMANAGGMFLHFGPHHPMAQQQMSTMIPQPPSSSNATTPSFVNFPMSPEMMAAAAAVNQSAPSPFTTTRISLTLDLPTTDQVYCMMPTPNDVETFNNAVMPDGGGVRQYFCSNCGANGHSPEDCCEATLDDITSAGQYHLNLRLNDEPAPPAPPPAQILFQQETH